MIKFYDYLLILLTPIIKLWGALHFPFTHKLITGKDYFLVRNKIEIGTIFLSKTYGEFSNLINPSKLKHAAIYVGSILDDEIKYVLEATGKGVILTDLVTFMTSKDELVVVRPKFIRNKDKFNSAIRYAAFNYNGVPYDYLFKPDGKAFYCFELCAACLKSAHPELQLHCRYIIKGKRVYDGNTFLDERFFEIISDSRGNYGC